MKSLTNKLKIYSALSVAGGITFGATAAEADIIFTDFSGSATQGNPLSIDLDGDLVTDFVFDFVVGPNGYGSNSNQAQLQAVGGSAVFAATSPAPFDAGPAYGPANLAFGDAISAQSFVGASGPLQLAYTSYNTATAFGAFGGANFPGGDASGYVGVEFQTGGGEAVFGWIGVSISGDVTTANFADAAINIQGFAYATNGDRITAGQTAVPEPSALGLLALGSAGLAIRRRKQH